MPGIALRDGMTGAELLALLHPFDIGRSHGFAYGTTTVSVHDMHAGGAEPVRRVDDM